MKEPPDESFHRITYDPNEICIVYQINKGRADIIQKSESIKKEPGIKSRIMLYVGSIWHVDGINWSEDTHHTNQDLPDCEDGRRNFVYPGSHSVVKTGCERVLFAGMN